MRSNRFSVTSNRLRGDVIVDASGIAFVPDSNSANGQLRLVGDATIDAEGWHYSWDDIFALERVMPNKRSRRADSDVRLHYDRCLRYVQLTVHGSVNEFFAVADAYALDIAESA